MLGVEGRDWKVVIGRKKSGGGKKRGKYIVKDAFLKRVAIARFRHCLTSRGSWKFAQSSAGGGSLDASMTSACGHHKKCTRYLRWLTPL